MENLSIIDSNESYWLYESQTVYLGDEIQQTILPQMRTCVGTFYGNLETMKGLVEHSFFKLKSTDKVLKTKSNFDTYAQKHNYNDLVLIFNYNLHIAEGIELGVDDPVEFAERIISQKSTLLLSSIGDKNITPHIIKVKNPLEIVGSKISKPTITLVYSPNGIFVARNTSSDFTKLL